MEEGKGVKKHQGLNCHGHKLNNKTCVDCVDPDSRNHQDGSSDDKGPHAVSDLEAGSEGEHNFVF